MNENSKHVVEIVEFETSEVIKTFATQPNLRTAEKLQRGADRNLNHGKFFTRVRFAKAGE